MRIKLRHACFYIFPLALLLFLPVEGIMDAKAQDPKLFKALFREAENHVIFEDYGEAIRVYKELLQLEPRNSNLHFLLGYTQMIVKYDIESTQYHLERACLDIDENYSEGSYREKSAPPLAHFILGRIYLKEYKFDMAIEEFNAYKEFLDRWAFAEIEYVNRYIKSCELAKIMVELPIEVDFIPQDTRFGNLDAISHPVVSGNDSILIFTIENGEERHIAMVEKLDSARWSKPRLIDEELKMTGIYNPVSLSFNADELYLSYKENLMEDIFVSYYNGRNWSTAEPVGVPVNSRYSETHASISSDKKTLYFTSNRKEGWGGMDIYRTVKDEKGNWSEPENLGFGINTYYNEETPFISQNDSVLYFSSEGHETMGGYDVFFTRIDEEGYFTKIMNMGFSVSTPDDDLFYNPGWDGVKGYQTRMDSTNVYELYAVINGSSYERPDYSARLAERDSILTTGLRISKIEKNNINKADTILTVVDTKSGKDRPVDEYYYILNNILFGYNQYELDSVAKDQAGHLARIMRLNEGIVIDLIGHTDAKGTYEYNLELSLKRAQSVKDFLIGQGISGDRINVDAYGEDDPIAINAYTDGRDAPLGRSLNRNVSIRFNTRGIDKVHLAEIFVPESLVPEQDKIFTVLLFESNQLIDTMPKMLNGEYVSLIYTSSTKFYTLGNYSSRRAAQDQLNELIDNGYPDASIMEKRRFENVIRERSTDEETTASLDYTIQIHALLSPVDPADIKELENVKCYAGKDGFYRYAYGRFATSTEARQQLEKVKELGFDTAFIRPLGYYKIMAPDR